MDGEIQKIDKGGQLNRKEIHDKNVLGLIPVQVVEDDSYITLKNIEPDIASPSNKGKYYKQTYRQAWEQMPDFAGWLIGVEGEPTRAFCLYCQKTLHAHRLSLLKHTCTIRHQKAAQQHQMRKISSRNKNDNKAEKDRGEIITGDNEDENIGESQSCEEDNSNDHDQEQMEDEDDIIEIDEMQMSQNLTKAIRGDDPPISTQVTDSVRGVPIAGLQVSLYKLIDGRWTYINEGFTNHNGRFSKFLEASNFTPGRYKMHFDVDKYFESKKLDSLYPFIEIVFDHRGTNNSFHIPLILSPNGYTTYKGS